MNHLTHQFNDMDETHLAMVHSVDLAKYISELRGEMETINEDIREEYNQEYIHPDYVSDYIESDGYTMIEHDELEKLKETITEQGEEIEKLEKEKKIYKEGMGEWQKEAKMLLSFQKEVDQMEAGLGEIHEDYEDMRFDDLPKVITDLREEIEKLEERLTESHSLIGKEFIEGTEKYNELKEENEKLKKVNRRWVDKLAELGHDDINLTDSDEE